MLKQNGAESLWKALHAIYMWNIHGEYITTIAYLHDDRQSYPACVCGIKPSHILMQTNLKQFWLASWGNFKWYMKQYENTVAMGTYPSARCQPSCSNRSRLTEDEKLWHANLLVGVIQRITICPLPIMTRNGQQLFHALGTKFQRKRKWGIWMCGWITYA